MSDRTPPAGGDSTNGAASDGSGRKRPTLAPMASSVTAAPMKTRPPMTPLPPLAPKPPPPPPEPEAKPVGKKSRKGLVLLVILAAAGGAAYYLFLR